MNYLSRLALLLMPKPREPWIKPLTPAPDNNEHAAIEADDLREHIQHEEPPMTHRLSKRSIKRMAKLHPDMVKVVYRASELLTLEGNGEIDFAVSECARTERRQAEMVRTGKSKTTNSRHLVKTALVYDEYLDVCHAVDLSALYKGRYTPNWPPYHVIAKAMKQAAKELGIPIKWGGDWKSFPDGPHYELTWDVYPIWKSTKAKHV